MKKVLAVFLSILTVMSFVSFTASAETLVYDNFKYYINNNVAVVSGYVSSDITSLNIPDTIDEYTVTNIGDNAFKNCKQLSQVQLPSGLTGIGKSAFYGCSELKEITIPSKVTYAGNAYTEGGPFGYSGLETVYLENGLTTVAENMFAYCKKLTSVEIPDSVTAIGKEAFKDCTSLSNLKFSKNLSSLGYLAFQNCTSLKTVNINFSGVTRITGQYEGGPFGGSGLETATISDDVTRLPTNLFDGCRKLVSVEIPDSVTAIGNEAFKNCTSLTNLKFSKNLSSLGYLAFQNCTSLKTVNINFSGVTSITGQYEGGPFGGSGLETVTINDDVTRIPSNLFDGCRKLVSVEIPDSVTTIGNEAFKNCISLSNLKLSKNLSSLGYLAFQNCTSLKSVHINFSGVTEVVRQAEGGPFAGSGLETVTFADDVTRIASNLLHGCGKITQIDIPDGVTYIGDMAFRNCYALSEVSMPKSLSTLGYLAFQNCTSLKSVHINFSGVTKVVRQAEGGPFAGSGLETVTFADDVTRIASNLLHGCGKITQIDIPDGVTYIGDMAFRNCYALSEVSMPKNLNSLGYLAFENCVSLKTVKINFNNVTRITYQYEGGPFGGSGLETVEIAEGVTQIPQYLFSKCSKLTTVILPSTIKTIDNYAFYNSANVKAVYFKNDIPNYATSAFSASTNCTVFGHETDGKSFAEKNKLNYVSISFDSESRRLNFSGNFKMYSDVDYSFLDKYYDGSMDIEYNHFDKLTFCEINSSDVEIPETSPLYSKLDNESEKLAFSDILLSTDNFVLSDSSDFSDILRLLEQDNKSTDIPSPDPDPEPEPEPEPQPEPEPEPEKSEFIQFIDNAFDFFIHGFRTMANTIIRIAKKIIKKK